MSNQEVIQTLNELIQVSRDGQQGFRTCAEGVRTPNFQNQLQQGSRRFSDSVQELETQVRNLGGQPSQGGTTAGSMHRAWTNIKTTITGMNEQSILAECERGEETARGAYEQALNQGNLPADVRSIVDRQYQSLKENQERVRNLRNTSSSSSS